MTFHLPLNRRNTLRLTLLLALLALPLATLQAQTDLYQRYAKQSGIKVASVSGFPLDSTSRVDVTVVEALDDDGWAWMKSEFHIGELADGQAESLREGNDVVLFARRSRSNPSDNAPLKRVANEGEQGSLMGEDIDAAASCYMGISYLQRAVYIFCADSEEQDDAIVSLLVKKIMHSSR